MPPSTSSVDESGPGGWGPAPPSPPTGPRSSPPLAPPPGSEATAPTTFVGQPTGAGRAPASRRAAVTARSWTRVVHVYTSMVALLVVLFFGATGLTLNHPEWSPGFDTTTSTVEGVVPDDAIADDGTVELLAVSEHLRSEEGVRGEVTDFGTTGTEAHISYRGPGYAADARIDTTSGAYTIEVEQQGLVGVLNDLHKGRDTNSSWGWLIDVSAVFLVAISLTGLLLQLLLRKRRSSALVVASVGGVVAVAVGVSTLL